MPPQPAVPIPAATVVVLRETAHGPEVLLTHRPATMAFAAGMHVFPGGRVDAADAAPELAPRRAGAGAAEAAHVAAIRELWEESGILLADSSAPAGELEAARQALVAGSAAFGDLADALDLCLRTDLLAPLSRWVTPPGYPRRFDAQFFAAVLPGRRRHTLDRQRRGRRARVVRGRRKPSTRWRTAGSACGFRPARRSSNWSSSATPAILPGSLPVRSGRSSSTNPLLAWCESSCRPGAELPASRSARTSSVAAGSCWSIPGTPPDRPSNGVSRRLPHEAGEISAIALTHADPDHHGGAEGLAERLDIPVFAGPGASRRLPYQVRELADGATIEHGDVTLRALATPGPRSDHLVYVVGGSTAVLTGDLDGRRGARMLPGPADHAAWAASRARLDTLGATLRLGGHPEP